MIRIIIIFIILNFVNSSDPYCQNGTKFGIICCASSCGTCGGTGCSSRPGGGNNCCGGSIMNANKSCDEYDAPCVIQPTPAPTLAPTTPLPPDPYCEYGLIDGNICCSSECGTCGGSGCANREGGSQNCCGGTILAANNSCDDRGAPCIIQPIIVDPLYMDYQVQEDYVPIIGYHKLGFTTDSLTITIDHFRDQISYLSDKCNWITATDLANYVKNNEKVPTNACLINFDDGSIDQYEYALCTLNTYKAVATYYLLYNGYTISPSYYVSPEQIKNLDEIGHDIESHSLTHPDLSSLNYAQQENQIIQSKILFENDGYNISTFAYPYGKYNDDTIEILKNSEYIFARDIENPTLARDPRPMTINYNSSYLWHFYYVKPEGLTGEELWEKIKYTGWWQFEDNFKIVNDTNDTITVHEYDSILPTNTSYAVVAMYNSGDEISTQFITKNYGGFTLKMVIYNSTKEAFTVKVDNITYDSYDFGKSYPVTFGTYNTSYNTFFINMDGLFSGVHTLNIRNNFDENLYLDKFSLYSNVTQDFIDYVYYKSCNETTDEYCTCQNITEAPPTTLAPADPNCTYGIANGNLCCMESCGVCGGSDCTSRDGGSYGCCGASIINRNISCDDFGAPCIITTPAPTMSPTLPPTTLPPADPFCEYGILKNNICCASECGTCGGSGCANRKGGSQNCCGGTILAANNSCDDRGAPCLVTSTHEPTPMPTESPTTQSPADPFCDYGILNGDICCAESCGTCGGSGCSSRPGGGNNCCGTPIINANKSCSDYGAPCIVTAVISTTSETFVKPDPNCEYGILKGGICCAESCGTCGGSGCGAREGGPEGCCGGNIMNSDKYCNETSAPCIMA